MKNPELPLVGSQAQESVRNGLRGMPASCEHCRSLHRPNSLFLHVPMTLGPLLSPLLPPPDIAFPWPPSPLG